MTPRINWKWPNNRQNGLLPWYVLAKNLLAVPFAISAVLSLLVYFFIVRGPRWCIAELKGFLRSYTAQ